MRKARYFILQLGSFFLMVCTVSSFCATKNLPSPCTVKKVVQILNKAPPPYSVEYLNKRPKYFRLMINMIQQGQVLENDDGTGFFVMILEGMAKPDALWIGLFNGENDVSNK